MNDRPILMSGQMVKAILEGRKTQTRRIVKPQPVQGDDAESGDIIFGAKHELLKVRPSTGRNMRARGWMNAHNYQPYGTAGDRLWVRETFSTEACACYEPCRCPSVWYKADFLEKVDPEDHPKWKPSIFMRRHQSRITLEIVNVRVERLHDIGESDARAEGIIDGGCLNCGNHEPCGCANPKPDARDAFIHLWRSINGEGSWAANPWVWVIEFRKASP